MLGGREAYFHFHYNQKTNTHFGMAQFDRTLGHYQQILSLHQLVALQIWEDGILKYLETEEGWNRRHRYQDLLEMSSRSRDS